MRHLGRMVMVISGVMLAAGMAQALNLIPPAGELHARGQAEFVVEGVPSASNPFDPDVIAVDVTFTQPSGAILPRPAFWQQSYSRRLENEQEILTPEGEPGWRVRFTPLASGAHHWRLTVVMNGAETASAEGDFAVLPAAEGYLPRVQVEPQSKRYLQLEDGTPFPLLGSCVCWHGGRGTYDYDDWFASMANARMNYARLWMWNVSFGIEFLEGERLNYNQERAWRLDCVMTAAEQRRIRLMLCFDYHGIFQVEPDYWGGNDWWPKHPYNVAKGGPCTSQNDFFTLDAAKQLYRKRLRYLTARYGAEPALMAWEFFNEIDIPFRYIRAKDVVAWHGEMADWLHANDPYQHLVTTSFAGPGLQAMWELPGMDMMQIHLYLDSENMAQRPAVYIPSRAHGFQDKIQKPLIFGEFGTDWRGYNEKKDVYRRGIEQGVWAGLMTGTAGTAMSWWWENLAKEDLHRFWKSLAGFIDGTGLGTASWKPALIETPDVKHALGAPIPNAAPFTIALTPVGKWGDKPEGTALVGGPSDAPLAQLHGYFHGIWKKELQVPCQIDADFAPDAKLILHLDSVSNDAMLAVSLNGQECFRKAYPNKDGQTEVNQEYNEDIEIPIPAGIQHIEIANPGGDWLYIDRFTLVNVIPHNTNGDGPPALDALALTDGTQALAWIVDRDYSYPLNMVNEARLLENAQFTLKGLPDGSYTVEWWDMANGAVAQTTTAACSGGQLPIQAIPFKVHIAARIKPAV